MDERFRMHRLYSTRFAALATLIAMFVWYNYNYFVRQTLRWDVVGFMAVMAVAKIGAMVWYRFKN